MLSPVGPRPNRARPIFIDCPFDADYKSLMQAACFAIMSCGYAPRCALDHSDSGVVRFTEIVKIIAESDRRPNPLLPPWHRPHPAHTDGTVFIPQTGSNNLLNSPRTTAYAPRARISDEDVSKRKRCSGISLNKSTNRRGTRISRSVRTRAAPSIRTATKNRPPPRPISSSAACIRSSSSP